MAQQPGLFDDDPQPAGRGPDRTSAADDRFRLALAAQHDDARALAAALPPRLHFGTSSWSFPGWAGIVYGGRRTPTALAREGLREYATHPLLTTVGVDRSFYAPVPVDDLRRYADQLPTGFPCCFKAPAAVTSRVRPDTRQTPNPDYLSASRLIEDLLESCAVAFLEHMGPIVIEFPPAPRELRLPPADFAARLDQFLDILPRDFTYAIELRDRSHLTPLYAAVLARHGATHTYNYWSAMPLPAAQAAAVPPDALTADTAVIRLLMRPGTRYEDQREAFRPFDRIVEPDAEMRDSTVALTRRLIALGKRVIMLVNNKAEGSAPLTIQAMAKQFAAAPVATSSSR